MTQLTQMQSRQSITDKSSAGVEASDPETGQQRRKSVAFSESHNIDEDPNDESPREGGLPNQSRTPANGQSSSPSPTSQEHSSNRGLRSNGSATAPQYTLGRSIRDEIFEPADKNLQPFPFLPRDKLEEVLTEQRIIEALGTEGRFPPERQGPIARDIISPRIVHPETQPHLQSRKEILAILSLIDKVSTIETFIKDSLFDYDLPFRYLKEPDSPNGYVVKTCDLLTGAREIPLFYQWSAFEIESFEGRQWTIHVPLFTGLPEKTEKPTHYALAQKAIAPYVSKVEVGEGGFSAVDKVEIHAAHVARSNNSSPKTVFAVKRLETSKKCKFDAEVSNLNRFAGKDAPHLVQLLWTFSLGPTYHLVFPCADGNLKDLWKLHHYPLAAEKNHDTALWFSRQCLGIVEGLHMIQQRSSSHDPLEPQKHGTHGDLKPENILWFRDPRGSEPGYSLGTLKISDFGLTRFNRTESKSHVNTDGIGWSPTYRAPEYDILHEVAQSYDIWCLACVLLEFTTWYIQGWPAVDKFSQRRKEEHWGQKVLKGWDHEFKQDTFFNHLHKPDAISAVAKKAVFDEVQTLYKHKNTSDFVIELVEFIETSLLRMHPERRKKCSDVLAQLQEFFDMSCKDRDYCLEPKKAPPKRKDTDLSDLSHPEPQLVDLPMPLHSSNVSLRRASLASSIRSTPYRNSNPVVLEEPVTDLDTRVLPTGPESQPQQPRTSMTDPDSNIHSENPPNIPTPIEDPETPETPEAPVEPVVPVTVIPEGNSQGPKQSVDLPENKSDEAGPVTLPEAQSDVEKVPSRAGAEYPPGRYERFKRTLCTFILCGK